MDKNQTIGLVLMSALLIAYMFFFSPSQEEQQEKQRTEQIQDSTRIAQEALAATQNGQNSESSQPIELDSATKALIADAKEIVLENDNIKVALSSLGAEILNVELKNYETFDKKPLILVDEQSSQIELSIPTSSGSVRIDKLGFKVQNATKEKVTFAGLVDGKSLEITYSLPKDGFELFYAIKTDAATQSLQFSWIDAIKRTDQNIELDRRETTINYYTTEEDFDYLSKGSNDAKTEGLENSVSWFSMKQRFFNAALITDKQFDDLTISSAAVNETDSSVIKALKVETSIPVSSLTADAKARFYFGPNKRDINETVADGFQKNTYLGWAVLQPISLYIIIPLFNILEKFISNYGILIIVMVFIIKMCLAPLTYKSYVAQARTKVLQPEINKIKEKYPDDQAKQSQETMKLNSEFGVNPLSGCLPMVLQMPIIFALFTFFPSAIQLRNEAFLWATDLSTYDSIINLPFTIPFYGNHVSLFTLMMTTSQILVTSVSTQQTSMANSPINPKVMMYGMPIMFMFVLNSFPAGLTLYYVTSNLVTLTQTLVIRKFFVNEDKIRAKLETRREEKKKSGKKGSSFMQRMQDAMAQAQEQQAVAKNKKEGTSKNENPNKKDKLK
ncbi:membrane protein insertase, YidC/Oxa1 family, N-terminal domain protein [Bernardetia litoralis DSM 6794]|uniref:Membrane protein insertase YidC n=1 Tax=Bernardetia litoralis (strain ATCC 23117 / DSM 6794 / NBRC 15988 / NCIMB 1366 / Fx l1 / Sio-4) TaxID=880071 RepID=I4ALU0_BERLS|nr:membrane protein insertase YidC [Bernardetia litoralis]AFM04925.1 membrane protein insertase, YidC/Oxa1 family, N-terminal domain protein [Bernardetia litoralis DSM 6794]